MKKALILVFLVCLFSVSALTEEVVLFQGQSFTFSDKNITLMGIGEDSIVACVNNQKGIIDETEIFNGVEFELDKLEDNYVEMTLKTDCNDCVCDESCGNNLCILDVIEDMEENETIEECENCTDFVEINNVVDDNGVIIGEDKKTNSLVYLSLFLFLLLVLIVLIFLLKKR
ncbi:MAG: hypothetical protein KJ674_03045 [Nanoarchaeota archaeon]|nr:hypothetical protein [Nanoarchaeota archaeon]